MTQQKAYVRARWKLALQCDGTYGEYPYGTVLIQSRNHVFESFSDWQAAYEFTVAREEEIRQLRAEIEALQINSYAGSDKFAASIGEGLNVARRTIHHCRLSRTLARLQQALEDLAKEMVKA